MNRLNVQWTAKTLVNQMKRGNVNFDNAVQRGLVWDVEKKSLLIHSMVYGYAIPAMYFTRDEKRFMTVWMESSGVMQSASLSVTSLRFLQIRLPYMMMTETWKKLVE